MYTIDSVITRYVLCTNLNVITTVRLNIVKKFHHKICIQSWCVCIIVKGVVIDISCPIRPFLFILENIAYISLLIHSESHFLFDVARILSNVKKVISDFKSEKSVFYTTLNVCTNELLIDKTNDLLTQFYKYIEIYILIELRILKKLVDINNKWVSKYIFNELYSNCFKSERKFLYVA